MEHTSDTIYTVLLDIREKIGKLDQCTEDILREAKRTNGRITRAESDINNLRGKWHYAAGIGTIIGAAFLAVWQWVTGK